MQKVIDLLFENRLLVIIVFLGLLIRVIQLEFIPPSLNWDEVSHGYNAYSLLTTGRDEWGQFLPLTNFRAYGDYPLPVNLYLTIPSIALFGLNEFAIRFPHALLGTAIIISTYFLVLGLKFGKKVAVLASLFVAIDPWTFFPSRGVFQSNVASFFLITGVAFFLYGKNKTWFLPLSALFIGVSLYSYHNTRIFVPLLLVAMSLIWFKEIKSYFLQKKKNFLFSALVLFAFVVPIIFILASSEGKARSKWVFLLDESAINKIGELRQDVNLPEPIKRLIYNKLSYFALEFTKNYVGYFSPQFLFFYGGTNYQFSVPDKGVLYPVNAPFFYLGLASISLAIFKKRKKEALFLISWLLLGLIPASMTQGQFHVIRSATIIPLPQIFVALGLVIFWNWVKNQNLRMLLFFIYAIALLYWVEDYTRTYIGSYRTQYSWAWQYGYKEVVQFARDNYDKYDQIIVTKKYGEPHEFFLFYWPWSSEKYRNDPNLIRFHQSDWYWVDRFDKFYFVNDWEVPKEANGKWKMESGGEVPISRTLLITSPANYPPGWKQLKVVNFPDGKQAFEVLEKVE